MIVTSVWLCDPTAGLQTVALQARHIHQGKWGLMFVNDGNLVQVGATTGGGVENLQTRSWEFIQGNAFIPTSVLLSVSITVTSQPLYTCMVVTVTFWLSSYSWMHIILFRNIQLRTIFGWILHLLHNYFKNARMWTTRPCYDCVRTSWRGWCPPTAASLQSPDLRRVAAQRSGERGGRVERERAVRAVLVVMLHTLS